MSSLIITCLGESVVSFDNTIAYIREDAMKRTLNLFVILSLCAVLTVFTLGSCSREQSVETDEGKMTVKEEGEKIKVTTDEGTITMSGDEEKGQIAIKTRREKHLMYPTEKTASLTISPKMFQYILLLRLR